jgi:hypothetical protein
MQLDRLWHRPEPVLFQIRVQLSARPRASACAVSGEGKTLDRNETQRRISAGKATMDENSAVRRKISATVLSAGGMEFCKSPCLTRA